MLKTVKFLLRPADQPAITPRITTCDQYNFKFELKDSPSRLLKLPKAFHYQQYPLLQKVCLLYRIPYITRETLGSTITLERR